MYDIVNTFTITSASVMADGPVFDGAAGAIRLAVGGDFRKEHSDGTNIVDGKENRGREVAAAFLNSRHRSWPGGRAQMSIAWICRSLVATTGIAMRVRPLTRKWA